MPAHPFVWIAEIFEESNYRLRRNEEEKKILAEQGAEPCHAALFFCLLILFLVFFLCRCCCVTCCGRCGCNGNRCCGCLADGLFNVHAVEGCNERLDP